jgi:hypothetical protein
MDLLTRKKSVESGRYANTKLTVMQGMKSTLYILVVLCWNIHRSIFWKVRKREARGWIVASEDYCVLVRILYWTRLVFYI